MLRKKVAETKKAAFPLTNYPPPPRRVFVVKDKDTDKISEEDSDDKDEIDINDNDKTDTDNINDSNEETENDDEIDIPTQSKETDSNEEEEELEEIEEIIDLGMNEFEADSLKSEEINKESLNLFPTQNPPSSSPHQARGALSGKTESI